MMKKLITKVKVAEIKIIMMIKIVTMMIDDDLVDGQGKDNSWHDCGLPHQRDPDYH